MIAIFYLELRAQQQQVPMQEQVLRVQVLRVQVLGLVQQQQVPSFPECRGLWRWPASAGWPPAGRRGSGKKRP